MALALTLRDGEGLWIEKDIYIRYKRYHAGQARLAITAPGLRVERIGEIDSINLPNAQPYQRPSTKEEREVELVRICGLTVEQVLAVIAHYERTTGKKAKDIKV